eukprot:gene7844-9313_t
MCPSEPELANQCRAACDCFGDPEFSASRKGYLDRYRVGIHQENKRRMCKVVQPSYNVTSLEWRQCQEWIDLVCLTWSCQVMSSSEVKEAKVNAAMTKKVAKGPGTKGHKPGVMSTDGFEDSEWNSITSPDHSAARAALMVKAREAMLVEEEKHLREAQSVAIAAKDAAEKARAAADEERKAAAEMRVSSAATRAELESQLLAAQEAARAAQVEAEAARLAAESEKRAASEMTATMAQQMAEQMAAQLAQQREKAEEIVVGAVALRWSWLLCAGVVVAPATDEVASATAQKVLAVEAEKAAKNTSEAKRAMEQMMEEVQHSTSERVQAAEAESAQRVQAAEAESAQRVQKAEQQAAKAARERERAQQAVAEAEALRLQVERRERQLNRTQASIMLMKERTREELKSKAEEDRQHMFREWERKVRTDIRTRTVATRQELFKMWEENLEKKQTEMVERKHAVAEERATKRDEARTEERALEARARAKLKAEQTAHKAVQTERERLGLSTTGAFYTGRWQRARGPGQIPEVQLLAAAAAAVTEHREAPLRPLVDPDQVGANPNKTGAAKAGSEDRNFKSPPSSKRYPYSVYKSNAI